MNIKLKAAIWQCPEIRSQIRLAAITGIREDRISRLVNEWVEPTAKERAEIASALSVATVDLWPATRPMTPEEMGRLLSEFEAKDQM